jgi:hypothetical protein
VFLLWAIVVLYVHVRFVIEIIGVLGSRLGRSGTSLILSLLPRSPLPIMGLACASWAASSWSVSRFISSSSAEPQQQQQQQQQDEDDNDAPKKHR